MTPYELVASRFQLVDHKGNPLTLYPLQAEAVNKLAPLPASGWWAEVGTGKTPMSTVAALYKLIVNRHRTVIVMPPILLKMWHKWLLSIRPKLSVCLYKGTPTERKQKSLNADFVLMSMGVFKNDFEHLMEQFENVPRTLIVDEATAVKNVSTWNYKRTKQFSEGCDLMLLTGTPLSSPGDAYAYVKLISPTIYRNQRHFEALHVEERDFFDNVKKWGNLEFLAENMKVNAVRMFKRDVMPWLKEPQYLPVPYELEPYHAALYKRLAEEQLLLLDTGGKIDATTATKLYNALQQIVCNPAHFTGDPTKRPAVYDLLDIAIEETDKLIVVANYRMTHAALSEYLKPVNGVAVYGAVSDAQKARNVDRFMNDKSCRVLHMHPGSGGMGLDELQHVCSDMMFIELPIVPWPFHQAVGRIDRGGMIKPATVRMPTAVRTIQMSLQERMLQKDELVNSVQGGWVDLRTAIFGTD